MKYDFLQIPKMGQRQKLDDDEDDGVQDDDGTFVDEDEDEDEDGEKPVKDMATAKNFGWERRRKHGTLSFQVIVIMIMIIKIIIMIIIVTVILIILFDFLASNLFSPQIKASFKL